MQASVVDSQEVAEGGPGIPHSRANELLDPSESARPEPRAAAVGPPPRGDLAAPLRAFDRRDDTARARAPELAIRFMNWVAAGVGSGGILYNESGALVHFYEQGALLLTPETFRRFVQAHAEAAGGPLAAAIAEGEEKAIKRVQKALRTSGWTVRNGDQNIHYFSFRSKAGVHPKRSSFWLIGTPELFWNPVPAPNPRLVRLPDPPKQLAVRAAPGAPAPTHKVAG